MSKSDEDEDILLPPPPKRRKFAYKNLSERIEGVNVDVYRQLGTIRPEPIAGAHSFFQEELQKWRELNTAEHFIQVAAAVHGMSQSFPLLVHHKADIVDILLQNIQMQAALSLEPLLMLLGALARDLQADYLMYIPKILIAFSNLVDSGAEAEPEILEHMFRSMSIVIRHLVKLLTPNIPSFLQQSSRLRHHRALHVRQLTAATLSYLFRHATTMQVRAGVRTLFAEHALQPLEVRADGAALLLAETCKGISHGLHSKADQILELAFKPTLLNSAKLGVQVKGSKVSAEQLQERCFEVNQGLLGLLLEHVRRGKIDVLWTELLSCADRDLCALEARSSPDALVEAQAAHSIANLSQSVEFHRGSRVEDYRPLLQLSARLCQPQLLATSTSSIKKPVESSLQLQTLRFLTAILAGHSQKIGASQGLEGLRPFAPEWAPVFEAVQGEWLLTFIRSLLRPPSGGQDIAALFAPRIIEAIARLWLSPEVTGKKAADEALLLLAELCEQVKPLGPHGYRRRLLEISPDGNRLASELQHIVVAWRAPPAEASLDDVQESCGKALCALHCLPFASSSVPQMIETYESLLSASGDGLAQGTAEQHSSLLALLAEASILKARALETLDTGSGKQSASLALSTMADLAIQLLKQHPSNFNTVKAAAEVLTKARAAGKRLSLPELEVLLPYMLDNLSSRSQAMRKETLTLLTCFDQPALESQAVESTTDTKLSDAKEDAQPPKELLSSLLRVELMHSTASLSRSAPVAIENLRTAFEFKKVPRQLVAPAVRCLLGFLNIRLSYIWPAAIAALGAALQHEPSTTWPPLLKRLQEIQHSFLTASGPKLTSDEELETISMGGLKHRLQLTIDLANPRNSGGATDASARLSSLLKAIALANPNFLVSSSKAWLPLFISYISAKTSSVEDATESQPCDPGAVGVPPGKEGKGVSAMSAVGGRIWRAHLKDWLGVVSAVKSPRNLSGAAKVRTAIASQLTDQDSSVQQAALKCLKPWKLKYLEEHLDRLLRLADETTLRAELTGFPLAVGSEGGILPQHRPGLIAVLVHILWPKMRKRSGRLAGKGAPGSARSAILNFLAAAESQDLVSLLQLFMLPLSPCILPKEDSVAEDQHDKLFDEPWWVQHLGKEPISWWFGVLDPEAVLVLPLRIKLGFLNAAGDLLQHLGHRLAPYLPEMSCLIVCFLESATISKDGQTVIEGAREIRSTSLRLLATILQRFSTSLDFNQLWPRFFKAIESCLKKLPIEVSADRIPPLLEVVSAMSRSPHLLPLLVNCSSCLEQSEDLLPSILQAPPDEEDWVAAEPGSRLLGQAFAGLGASHCAQPARDACLGIVEAILDYGDAVAEKVLQQHLGCILNALRQLAVGEGNSSKPKAGGKAKKVQQGSGKRTSLRALAILERLSALDYPPQLSEQLVDALLPLLLNSADVRKGKGRGDQASTIRVLTVLSSIWDREVMSGRVSGVKGRELGVANALAPLAGQLDDRQAGLSLATAAKALARMEVRLAPAAEVFEGLVAVSSDAIDGLDYDARLAAYRKLDPPLWQHIMTCAGAPMLLQRAFLDLRNGEDLALRHAAAQALARAIQAASSLSPEEEGEKDLIAKVIFPAAKKAINASNLAVRQEHLSILRSLCIAFPEKLSELHALTSTDIEIDFFANIAHLQVHRRTRALHRLVKVLKEDKLGPGVLLSIAMPIISQMILEGRAQESQGHELKDADKDRDTNVVDVAIQTLGEMASHMSWPHYQQLLGHFLKAMRQQAETNKAIIRAVCTLIDSFHFQVLPSIVEAAASPEPGQPPSAIERAADADVEIADEPEVAESTGHYGKEPDANSGREILGTLTRRVLPALQSALVVKSGEAIRSPVALALVKLLRLLPQEATKTALPRALQGVANLLRNRLQRIRDDARNVMAAMVAELGTDYLGFALDVLESALPSKGYMGHIRGYTLHYLLQGLCKDMKPGSLDETLLRILPMIDAQLFGIVAEEKEAGAFAGTREAKKLRAYDTYQLLAQGITFKANLATMLSLVRGRLGQADSPTVRLKLSRLLEAAQKGIALNPTAAPEGILIFVSSILGQVVPAEAESARQAEAAAEAASNANDGEAMEASQSNTSRHQHLLLEFALTLLQRGLKKGALGGSSPKMLAMLDPLLPFLVTSLSSRHSLVVELSLRIFAQLVQLPLPGLASAAPGAAQAMTTLLQNSPSTMSPIAQECLRVLASLLRTCPEWAPTTPQLQFLITWALSDIEEAAAHVAAFALLRGVIKRRLVVPEVYDVVGKVEDLMVRSQALSVRRLCSTTLLQFLLDYPVGEKRFQQHMHKLIANLSYEHESGRLAAIDMLSVLLTKLPQEILTTYALIFFVPLVTRLVNDPSAKCRQEIGSALTTLLKAVTLAEVTMFSECCASWLSGEDGRLKRAAVQAFGFIAEQEAPQFGKRIRPQIPQLTAILNVHSVKEASAPEQVDQEASADGPDTPQAWQEAYHTLNLLIKIMKHCPRELRWSTGEGARKVWKTLPGLILHSHLWVRKLTADLLGLGFADPAVWDGYVEEDKDAPSRLSALLYQQLEATEAKQADLLQTSKCLIFLAPHLYSLDERKGRLPAQQQPIQEHDDEEDAGQGQEHEKSSGHLSMYGLMRRISRLADDRTFPHQTSRLTALRFLAAITTRLGAQRTGAFLPTMLRPLFRITEGLSPNPPEVVDLAQEVVAHIRQVAGSDALLEAFNNARASVIAARNERKRQQAVQAMLDPQAAAKGKLQKQVRRAAGRKRKMEELARIRSAGAPVKNKRMKKVMNTNLV